MASLVDTSELSDFFKTLREESGMTQLQLSKALGYRSSQLVSNWERGICSPPLQSVGKMIDIFGIPKARVVQILLKASKTYFESQIVVPHRRVRSK